MPAPELLQIKASAGSGKTYTLTRKYLAKLATSMNRKPVSPYSAQVPANEIIAITFTNAAAAEMRARVIGYLKSVALGLEEGQISCSQAKSWLDCLLQNIDNLNIRTIDSLLQQISRASALELNLNPDFEPVFSTEQSLKPFIDLFLEQAMEEGICRDLLTAAFKAIFETGKARGFTNGQKFSSKLGKVLEKALLEEFNSVSSSDELLAVLESLREKAISAAATLLEKVDMSKLKANARKAFDAHARGEFGEKASEYAKKDNLEACLNKCGHATPQAQLAYEHYCIAISEFYTARSAITRANIYAPFIELANVIRTAFLQNLHLETQIPFSLVSSYAHTVLCDGKGVSQTICRLGSRLHHFLVDEFQDTSHGQWQVLRYLVANALSQGGSLIWVGDVKQSIYSWRGGDASLFDKVAADPLLLPIVPRPQVNCLDKNWRSARAIVEHTNRLFSTVRDKSVAQNIMRLILPTEIPDNYMDSAVNRLQTAYTDVDQECVNNSIEGLVAVKKVVGSSQPELKESSLNEVLKLLQEDIGKRRPWSDVYILVRNNLLARAFAEKLAEANIPAITENSLLLSENHLIIQTVAFLEFLNNPADDTAFLTVVTGSLYAAQLTRFNLAVEDILDLASGSRGNSLHEEFASHYPELWNVTIGQFYNQALLMTPYDTVMEWYGRMDAEKRFIKELPILRAFLEVVYNAENNGYGSLTSFLEYWRLHGNEEKIAMPDSMNAVRIMTIHKAKGLEAPVAIIPATNYDIKASDDLDVVYIKDHQAVININNKGAGEKYYENHIRQILEAINIFYVAATRAREELYIFHTSMDDRKGRKEGARSSRRFSAVFDIILKAAHLTSPYEMGSLTTSQKNKFAHADTEVVGNPKNITCLPETVTTGLSVDPPMQWLPRLKIFHNHLSSPGLSPEQRGTFLHFCLEKLQVTGDPHKDAAQTLNFGLKYSNIPVPEDKMLRSGLLDALQWFAAIPYASSWIEKGWPEHSLMTSSGQLLRADLLVREPWGWLIIDYKTGKPDKEHIRQMQNYLACINDCEDTADNFWGMLVYLDERCFQKVTQDSASELLPDCTEFFNNAG